MEPNIKSKIWFSKVKRCEVIVRTYSHNIGIHSKYRNHCQSWEIGDILAKHTLTAPKRQETLQKNEVKRRDQKLMTRLVKWEADGLICSHTLQLDPFSLSRSYIKVSCPQTRENSRTLLFHTPSLTQKPPSLGGTNTELHEFSSGSNTPRLPGMFLSMKYTLFLTRAYEYTETDCSLFNSSHVCVLGSYMSMNLDPLPERWSSIMLKRV